MTKYQFPIRIRELVLVGATVILTLTISQLVRSSPVLQTIQGSSSISTPNALTSNEISHSIQPKAKAALDITPARRTNSTGTPTKYAIVHIVHNLAGSPAYEMATFISAHRIAQIHHYQRDVQKQPEETDAPTDSTPLHCGADYQLDLVVMVPEGTSTAGYEHPFIHYVTFNKAEMEAAITKDKWYWSPTFFKLAAATLTDYSKVVVVDVDILLYQSLWPTLYESTTPAMVPWTQYPSEDYNSGLHVLGPSMELYQDYLTVIRGMRDNNSNGVLNELKRRSHQDAMKENGKNENPYELASVRSDQEFLYSFYNIFPATRSKWGPIHPLPYGINAREESVSATENHLLRHKGDPNPRQAASIFSTTLLHLYGGYGQDGFGGFWNPNPIETSGRYGLVGVHFTTRKPWKDKSVGNPDPDQEALHRTPLPPPQVRCPRNFHHVQYWLAAFQAIREACAVEPAAGDVYYGRRWIQTIHTFLSRPFRLLDTCFEPEVKEVLGLMSSYLKQEPSAEKSSFAPRPLVAACPSSTAPAKPSTEATSPSESNSNNTTPTL